MKNKFELLLSFFVCVTHHLVSAEDLPFDVKSINYEICSPIPDVPNSLRSLIAGRILGESKIELAMLSSGQDGFHAVIIWTKEGVLLCDYRVINYNDISSDKVFDKNLISKAKVHIKSRPIGQKKVDILKETLKAQIQMATYKVDRDFNWSNFTGGNVFDVYVKGDKNDVFSTWSARFFNPLFEGSYRCDYIFLALEIFSSNQKESFREVPLSDLTQYLIDRKNGILHATDPSLKDAVDDISLDPPDY